MGLRDSCHLSQISKITVEDIEQRFQRAFAQSKNQPALQCLLLQQRTLKALHVYYNTGTIHVVVIRL